MNKKKGFTLIEVLIVLAIIVMLAAIVIVAINPARQFAQARNTQRWSAINAILNAVHQNMADNNGSFSFTNCSAGAMPSTTTEITKTGGLDLCGCLSPLYVATVPYDPSDGSYTDCSTYDTGYYISQNSTTSRVTVTAPSAELSETISVTR